jgi:hypothetical protein
LINELFLPKGTETTKINVENPWCCIYFNIIYKSGFRKSGKITTLIGSTYTVRYAVTLKWLPIVFVRLIQSTYSYGREVRAGIHLPGYDYGKIVPTHTKDTLFISY